MFRRRTLVGRRGPGLAGTVARTAVVAGTASATSSAVHSRQQQAQQASLDETEREQSVVQLERHVAELQAQQLQDGVSSLHVERSPAPDIITQLSQLAQMLEAGHLSQEEFNQAKAKVLAA